MARFASCLLAVLVVLGAGLSAPAPARAHWENTRWGMTPAQVKALYPAAKEVPARPEIRGSTLRLHVDGPVTVRSWRFTSIDFHFERAGKLTRVTLVPTDDWGMQLDFYAAFYLGETVEIAGSRELEAGRSMEAYEAFYRSARTGDEGALRILHFLGATLTTIETWAPDPVVTRAREAARRLKQLRDSGAAPRPAGGWNNTRWTMTREQVLALYPAAQQDNRGRLHLAQPFTWQGRTWSEVAFEFRTDYGLEGVRLWTSEDQIPALEAEATARYGAPTNRYGQPPSTDELALYAVIYPDTAAGEEVYVFSSRMQSDRGTGLFIGAPSDTAALNAALAAPDPGPPPLVLRWRMTPAEFLKLYPSATSNGENSPFYTVMSPTLLGRTWKRAIFKFSYGDLDEYTLFSTDRFDAILAGLTARYGPPQPQQMGSITSYWFEDNASLSSFRVMPVHDGTAIVTVSRKG